MTGAAVFFRRESTVYIFAILTSLLLSFWIDYRESVINPDAICYLLSAKAVGTSGMKAAMQLCPQAKWPFYPAFIYGFVQITHLSYPVAAYVLDALFSALSVMLFIRIVKELGGSRSVMWLAAGVILLSHEFNSVREYIIRDHGFWAFYLASLFFLLRFFSVPGWRLAFGFSFSLLIATLFRIEGLIFLLTLPFLIGLMRRYTLAQRLTFFCMLNVPVFLIGLSLTGWLLLHPQAALDKLGRVGEVMTQLQQGLHIITTRYDAASNSLAEHVLLPESANDAGLILFLVLMVWYLISVISNLSWIYGLLATYAWLKKTKPMTWAAAIVLGGYIVVNIAVTLGFLMERLFLSKRYLIALSLIFMLWVPFGLHHLMQKWPSMRHRIFLLAAAFFILISSAGGVFDFGYSKSYIHEAGDWLAKNVPAEAALYANDYQLMYYSGHYGEAIFEKQPDYRRLQGLANDQWKQYDYLAFRVSRKKGGKMASLLSEINLVPIREFSNKRGDKIVIYKVS